MDAATKPHGWVHGVPCMSTPFRHTRRNTEPTKLLLLLLLT